MTSVVMSKSEFRAEPSANVLGIRESTELAAPSQAATADAEVVRLRTLRSEPVVLRLSHIGKSYPIAGSDDRVVALKDITLAELDDSSDARTVVTAATTEQDPLPPPFGPVRRGEFVMIRGPSGGGKTTLLNIIGTIDACTEGTIELNGRQIDKDTKENILADIRLKSLGFVFQTFNLIATMTAAENVELPMTLLGKLSSKEMRLRSRQLLTLVGLRNRINHLPSELSGGEQQRVTIARSLANNPSLLLLDEPTGDLDTANTIEIMDLLTRINRRTKTTCIMVTHNPDIECYADRILYVNDGRFGKEVYNSIPTCLSLEKYTKYLAEKEKQITGLTHINENASSDAEDDEAVRSVGGSMVRLHRDSRANSSFLGVSHNGGELAPTPSQPPHQQRLAPLQLQREGSDLLSEGNTPDRRRSSENTPTFLRRSANASAANKQQPQHHPVNSTPLSGNPRPVWQKNWPQPASAGGDGGSLPASSSAVPPSASANLTRVAQREEREAANGM